MLTISFRPFEPGVTLPKKVILVLLRDCAGTFITDGCRADANSYSCRIFPAFPIFSSDAWGREYLSGLLFISPPAVWAWKQPEIPASIACLPKSDPYWEGDFSYNHPDVYQAQITSNLGTDQILQFCEGWAEIC